MAWLCSPGRVQVGDSRGLNCALWPLIGVSWSLGFVSQDLAWDCPYLPRVPRCKFPPPAADGAQGTGFLQTQPAGQLLTGAFWPGCSFLGRSWVSSPSCGYSFPLGDVPPK